MKYRNTKTGFVFENSSELRGENWELIEEAPSKPSEPNAKPKTKTTRKKKEAE